MHVDVWTLHSFILESFSFSFPTEALVEDETSAGLFRVFVASLVKSEVNVQKITSGKCRFQFVYSTLSLIQGKPHLSQGCLQTSSGGYNTSPHPTSTPTAQTSTQMRGLTFTTSHSTLHQSTKTIHSSYV